MGRSTTKEMMNGEERRRYGATVSFSTDTGDRAVYHECGVSVTECVRRCIEKIERRGDDGRWYVDAISTPQTIFVDLHGGNAGSPMFRERQILSSLGRLDMLRVPLLRPDADSTKRPGWMWRKLHGRGPLGGVR